ncbi:group II intron reverse transcriptase/maturase [Paenibacillus chibensis]|uniref:group II intron reverse transcriptase/maturase n=1 Tax=Paenibacillus chibensis TaxID=59846 RepID=UPI000FDBC5E9|nr:group II intron reverse transcriptase/maturase [Paenibacillus chibensis]MEC0369988.1 group II intron reverse transcriptase/maturase [Paenibacillus chibensis]
MTYETELSEAELKIVKDDLYEQSSNGKRDFHGLLELILMRENLIHAIRKVKSNPGFKTAGVDEITGQVWLQIDAEEAFDKLRDCIIDYSPDKVRRVFIPKSNGKQRPLGIPTIVDRIIQTAVNNILEPILEATMFRHSYGFRPMRDISHAVAYMQRLTTMNKRHFVLEGDIKGYFDNIDHNILIRKLYKYGIRDKRVLTVVKRILKSGIDGEKEVNDIGTPQGGTISTLLSNVYLTDFDHWVCNQWLDFKTDREYTRVLRKHENLRKNSRLKEGYLIRYADDWIILTDTEESAVKWKYACAKYLREKLKIELSDEKTIITDLRKDKMNFLGITFFKKPGNNGNYTLRSEPSQARLKEKTKDVYDALRKIRRSPNKYDLVENIQRYNSIVRGLNNFYRMTTLYSVVLPHLDWKLAKALVATKHKHNGKWVKLKNCNNLYSEAITHPDSNTLAFKIDGVYVGLAKLGLGKTIHPNVKAQWITPYSAKGRAKYEEITGHTWTTINRNPNLTIGNISNLLARNSNKGTFYNLEYFINRPMAFNRDKMKCRECGTELTGAGDTDIHHIDPTLDISLVNKLPNLVTLCKSCHIEEHRKRREAKKATKKSKGATKRAARPTVAKEPRPSKKPPKDELLELITTTSYTQIGLKFGVSDNAVKKWAISYGIHELRLFKIVQK